MLNYFLTKLYGLSMIPMSIGLLFTKHSKEILQQNLLMEQFLFTIPEMDNYI
jgi:hypothetical protein